MIYIYLFLFSVTLELEWELIIGFLVLLYILKEMQYPNNNYSFNFKHFYNFIVCPPESADRLINNNCIFHIIYDKSTETMERTYSYIKLQQR